MRQAVKWFSEIMEKQMKTEDWQNPWENGATPCLHFYVKMKNEKERLYEAMIDFHLSHSEMDADTVIKKAADIANKAMIIAAMHNPEMGKLNRGR